MLGSPVRLGMLGLIGVVLLGLGWWLYAIWSEPPSDPRLAQFVQNRPPVPIVFTSRTEPASCVAAAPTGEGFHGTGQPLWAAREGRLRVLKPNGQVHELTWTKPLPDGDTLIDVMSPSLSLDGQRVLFAGRRRDDGHGRFRLYEIGLNGEGLRQLTGLADDPGCTELPPLRWDADGKVLSDSSRRQIDYDDVDPIELNDAGQSILFVSSRTPDLGRDHSRRSTTLWKLQRDGTKQPASGNRNNDRWPFLLNSGYTSFTTWSRNREVISANGREIAPLLHRDKPLSQPTDLWQSVFTQIPGGHFGMLAKLDLPTWRTRPLFANRLIFMTTRGQPKLDGTDQLTIAQVVPGTISHSPSSSAKTGVKTAPLPIRYGPSVDAAGHPLWLATPSACPPNQVVLSAASLASNATQPQAGEYGLYLASDDWPESGEPPTVDSINWRPLFDDPELVDAEPVAVYHRGIAIRQPNTENRSLATAAGSLRMETGTEYRGPFGQLFATGLDGPTTMGELPGQQTDARQGPIYDSPPVGAIDHLRIYAARRDRFDDPIQPRIPGAFELILKLPVQNGASGGWVPTDFPSVLAGFDRDGRIVEWSTPAKDRTGQSSRFYAFAGDHYSLAAPQGKHFCVGCHAGHSGLPPVSHQHAERNR